MPWESKKRGDKWIVTKEGENRALSTHDTKAEAQAAVRARYANTNEGDRSEPKNRKKGPKSKRNRKRRQS